MSLPLDNLKNLKALSRFIGTCAVGLAIDLWTKHAAVERLKESRDVIEFIPGWLHFEYTENHGAVFGIGQGQWLLFVVVSVFAIGLLTYLFTTGSKKPLPQMVLGMLLAGVLGNMYDRIAFGYVRDMIHAIPRWPNAFPWIFNIADSLLCVGVFFMIVYSLFFAPRVPDERRGSPVDEQVSV